MYRESQQLEPKVSAVDLDTIDLIETRQRIDKMIERETRGYGDTANALERICEQYRLPFWTLNRIREGKAKTVNGGIIRRVRHAYVAYCERQIRLLQNEIETHKVVAPDDDVSDLDGEVSRLAAKVAAMREALNG